jgi:putative membrane protein
MSIYIDILTSELFALGFSGLLIFYVAVQSCLLKRKGMDARPAMQQSKIPLAMLGAYIAITGLFGQFAWPLPGSYNILFYDLYPLWGFFLLGLSLTLHTKNKLQYMGIFGLFIGFMALIYGYYGYGLGMTQAPIALLGMYSLFGLAGILGYPVSLIFDGTQGKAAGKKWQGWETVVTLFAVFLLFASLLAIFIGASAVPAHLQTPP